MHSFECKDHKLIIRIIKNSVNYSFSIKAKFTIRIHFENINLQLVGALRFDINLIHYYIEILYLDKKNFIVGIYRSFYFIKYTEIIFML